MKVTCHISKFAIFSNVENSFEKSENQMETFLKLIFLMLTYRNRNISKRMTFQNVNATYVGSKRETLQWMITYEDSKDLKPKGFIDQLREAFGEPFQEAKCVKELTQQGKPHLHSMIKLQKSLSPSVLRNKLITHFGRDTTQWINYQKVKRRDGAHEYICKDLTPQRTGDEWQWQTESFGHTEKRTPGLNGLVTKAMNKQIRERNKIRDKTIIYWLDFYHLVNSPLCSFESNYTCLKMGNVHHKPLDGPEEWALGVYCQRNWRGIVYRFSKRVMPLKPYVFQDRKGLFDLMKTK